MQMTKPRAVFVTGDGSTDPVWIVKSHGMFTMGACLDASVKRHTGKLLRRVTGPKAVHRSHYPHLHQ